MSKPKKPGELRDVDVDAISLVNKAANRKRFKIFKSAEEEPQEPPHTEETKEDARDKTPEVIEKNEQGLFTVLKKFFMGEEVTKGQEEKTDKSRKLGNAADALFQIFGGEGKAETDAKKIRTVLKNFASAAEEISLNSDEEVIKVVEELEKSGRKVSGARLAKLKSIQSILTDVLSEIENIEEGQDIMTQAEVTKAVEEALKPINERIEKLEVSEKEDKAPETAATPDQPEETDVVKSVKFAIAEAIAPLSARLEKIEKARGFSNKVPEDTQPVEKNADMWTGIF